MKGTVKWFDNQKGYGFISSDNGDKVFVHFSDINGQELNENDKIIFDTFMYGQLLRAKNVSKVKKLRRKINE